VEPNKVDSPAEDCTSALRGRSAYGVELILDLHGCDPATFTRGSLDRFFTELCDVIKMERCVVHFWDDVGVPEEERQTLPHTKGTSAVCFILTSSIVIHTLDILEAVYLNIFSCKPFDPVVATAFAKNWFCAQDVNPSFLTRL
jgi:S-adenosylmethionine/arginine decarboxylase-like enzyme